MAKSQQDWGYDEMPPSEGQPTPEQTAAFKLANALKSGDAVAAQAALDTLKQTPSAGRCIWKPRRLSKSPRWMDIRFHGRC